MTRDGAGWLGLAWLAFAVLPWYVLPGDGLAGSCAGSALPGCRHGARSGPGAPPRPGLAPSGGSPLLLPLLIWRRPRRTPASRPLVAGGGRRRSRGSALQGLAIDHRGWSAGWLASLLGAPGPSQAGFGTGALLWAWRASCSSATASRRGAS